MKKFQYKTINIAKGDVQNILDFEGREGWQVVAVEKRDYLLMRECIEIPDYPPQQLQKGVLVRGKGERIAKCELCGFRPYRHRVTNDLGDDALVCKTCYPKTQPEPKKVVVACTNHMCKDGYVYDRRTHDHRAPCYTCSPVVFGTCNRCNHRDTQIVYRNALGSLARLCWNCYGTSHGVETLPFKHTSMIESVEHLSTKVEWRGVCTCGYKCNTDISRAWVEDHLRTHNHCAPGTTFEYQSGRPDNR